MAFNLGWKCTTLRIFKSLPLSLFPFLFSPLPPLPPPHLPISFSIPYKSIRFLGTDPETYLYSHSPVQPDPRYSELLFWWSDVLDSILFNSFIRGSIKENLHILGLLWLRDKGLGTTSNSEQMHSCLCQRRQSQALNLHVFTKIWSKKNNISGTQPFLMFQGRTQGRNYSLR